MHGLIVIGFGLLYYCFSSLSIYTYTSQIAYRSTASLLVDSISSTAVLFDCLFADSDYNFVIGPALTDLGVTLSHVFITQGDIDVYGACNELHAKNPSVPIYTASQNVLNQINIEAPVIVEDFFKKGQYFFSNWSVPLQLAPSSAYNFPTTDAITTRSYVRNECNYTDVFYVNDGFTKAAFMGDFLFKDTYLTMKRAIEGNWVGDWIANLQVAQTDLKTVNITDLYGGHANVNSYPLNTSLMDTQITYINVFYEVSEAALSPEACVEAVFILYPTYTGIPWLEESCAAAKANNWNLNPSGVVTTAEIPTTSNSPPPYLIFNIFILLLELFL